MFRLRASVLRRAAAVTYLAIVERGADWYVTSAPIDPSGGNSARMFDLPKLVREPAGAAAAGDLPSVEELAWDSPRDQDHVQWLLGRLPLDTTGLAATLHGRNQVDSILLNDVAGNGFNVMANTFVVSKESDLFAWVEAQGGKSSKLYVRAQKGHARECVGVNFSTHMKLAHCTSGPAGDLPAMHAQYVATGKFPDGCRLEKLLLGNSNICRFTGETASTETNLQIFDDHAALGCGPAAAQPTQDRFLSLGQILYRGGPDYPNLRAAARKRCREHDTMLQEIAYTKLDPETRANIDFHRARYGRDLLLNTTKRGNNRFVGVSCRQYGTKRMGWSYRWWGPNTKGVECWQRTGVKSELEGAIGHASWRASQLQAQVVHQAPASGATPVIAYPIRPAIPAGDGDGGEPSISGERAAAAPVATAAVTAASASRAALPPHLLWAPLGELRACLRKKTCTRPNQHQGPCRT